MCRLCLAALIVVGWGFSARAQVELIPDPPERESKFSVVSVELRVADVTKAVAFFRKLGFALRWAMEPADDGYVGSASMTGGVARVWLTRADLTDADRAAAARLGAVSFFIDGGPAALAAQRRRVVEAGIEVTDLPDMPSFKRFEVRSSDGYRIGFHAMQR